MRSAVPRRPAASAGEDVAEAQASARSSRAIMCGALGRASPFLQRLVVCGWAPRRRFSSAHDKPDSVLKRSRRSGKSPGKS